MTADDDFKTLRRYTREEAAQLLHIPPTWLKRWVTKREVPHQRSGQERGVWFTHADIVAIGGQLPKLMSVTRANRRAETAAPTGTDGDEAPGLAAAPVAEIGEDDLAAFRNLRSISSKRTS